MYPRQHLDAQRDLHWVTCPVWVTLCLISVTCWVTGGVWLRDRMSLMPDATRNFVSLCCLLPGGWSGVSVRGLTGLRVVTTEQGRASLTTQSSPAFRPVNRPPASDWASVAEILWSNYLSSSHLTPHTSHLTTHHGSIFLQLLGAG